MLCSAGAVDGIYGDPGAARVVSSRVDQMIYQMEQRHLERGGQGHAYKSNSSAIVRPDVLRCNSKNHYDTIQSVRSRGRSFRGARGSFL